MKQWDIKSKTVFKDFGKVHSSGIYSIVLASEDEFLFTSDVSGKLKQWDVKTGTLLKHQGCVHPRKVCSMVTLN